ncbi:lytic transglycosylase domain-containing protein [Geomonas sp. Red69]|uniref:Lytic transglycosylase domain-containing protein n=2 Tax=Geomonas diazotrophica TaxID=2843197 RepID=A0ABX8JHX0_9BACT|nr:lytic transglycosylase domain-containing protein [Geomonas diazotrophica]QWV97581.1 lytic transglycosylase domain-containing protein [Geomonas nitrogeniifigens]QXE86722.1 lytic transglycosylase domain-containing protein [Geomonas nitrogeniifigens]
MMGKARLLYAAAALMLVAATDASAFCFEEAGVEYGINPQILRAIAKVESNFNPAAVNYNTNGTYDFGLMQINSSWAPTIGKQRWNSLGDPCNSVKTGAWILSMCMEKYGYTWKAIGCYNSQTPDKRDRYSKKVFDQLQRVKPVRQEAEYRPLKDSLEALVRQKVDGWVDEAAKGKSDEFKEKVKGTVPTPKEVLQQKAAPAETTAKSALPPATPPSNSISQDNIGYYTEDGEHSAIPIP